MARYAFQSLRAAVMGILLGGSAVCVSGGADGEDEQRAALLAAQIRNDMFYGADDYFGEHRDLAYVDRVKPTTVAVKTESSEPEAAPATRTGDDSSTGSGTVVNGGSDGDSGSGSDPDPGDDDDSSAEQPVGDRPSDDGADDTIADDVGDDVSDDVGDDDAGGG